MSQTSQGPAANGARQGISADLNSPASTENQPKTQQDIAASNSLADPVLAGHAAAIHHLAGRVVADVIEIGRRLTDAKRICGHGNFGLWLKREFRWSEDTAERYMRVADLDKFRTVRNLDLPLKGLYLLAASSTPEAARDEIIGRATAGEPVSVAEVKHAIDQFKADGRAAQQTVHYSIQAWKALAELDRKRIITEANGNSQFNAQSNDSIEWARWSWNPVTGCLHDCKYCYAHDIADRFYEQGFEPTFLPDRLIAPRNTKVPKQAATEIGFRNVFVCSMADLFGKWVPEDWIEAVFNRVRTHPEWNFLFLTKFPQRLAEREWPVNAWCGTTVDTQARVKIAERAFRDVKAGVRWLSVEPMMERLTFTSLEMFNWIVIGGATRSTRTPAFDPPMEWVLHLLRQAHVAGIESVYAKANLRALRGYPGLPAPPTVPADADAEVVS